MKTDIEISNEAKKLDIKKIAKKLNIGNRYLECYTDEIIKPNQKMKINNEGFKVKDSNLKGDLIIEFEIEFL